MGCTQVSGDAPANGLKKAIGKCNDQDLKAALSRLSDEERQRLIKAANAASWKASEQAVKYAADMLVQWQKVLADPTKVLDTACSKRSPFKFDRSNSMGAVDLNVGVSAVALPDPGTLFGAAYLKTVDTIQDLFKEYCAAGTKRQTTPHMSIGSVVLDKKTPTLYNEEIERRAGLIPSVKRYFDVLSEPPRAKIQTLKINPDGCVTFQLEHDPGQDCSMTEAELDEALRKVPTCEAEEDAAKERKRFRRKEDGSVAVSRFQQVRLQIGALGSEIKGMYPAGHMVVVNLVDVKEMEKVPRERLEELFARCHEAFAPLLGEWFELSNSVCLCYVERSLNEGSVVLAPKPGEPPRAFPESSETAQSLLGGVFTATAAGDVLIDIERFEARRDNKGSNEWQAFGGEVREMASNKLGISDLTRMHPKERLLAAFKVFDVDGSGSIDVEELGKVMDSLGEHLEAKQLAAMMKSADKDGTGQIDYEEFVMVMKGET